LASALGACRRISFGGKIEYGLIPLGSIGMTIFALAVSFQGLTFIQVVVLLAFLALPADSYCSH